MSRVAKALDLAVLKPTATIDDVLSACRTVQAFGIHAVCVAPINVLTCIDQGVRTCAVIGFPHGTTTRRQKHNEAFEAVVMGALELDIVINYGRFLGGDWLVIMQELNCIVDSVPAHITTKAILETCYLSDCQLREVSKICVETGVDFIETATGFGQHGAVEHDIKIMLDAVKGTRTQVKASGGIANIGLAIRFLNLGCTRIGASQLF